MTITKTIAIDRTPFSGLDRLGGHLGYHANRQELIAANLANIDTPGYRSRDISFRETFSAQLDTHGTLRRKMTQGESGYIRDDETPDQDGNSVSLETQMARTTANTLRYQMISELLSRKLGMLKYAAQDGR